MTDSSHGAAPSPGLHEDRKPRVLFLCVHNAGRSQMAMGFFQHLAGDRAVAWSGRLGARHHRQPRRRRG
jgi:protein-tyrosine-phosphatase